MDSSATNFELSPHKSCNFCDDFSYKNKKVIQNSDAKLDKLLKDLKKTKKNKYDCIVGLSGGIDSAYTLVKVKELGLNPLAVHMDNGWNSELSQNNIQKLVESLNVDFESYIIDWEEYRDLMNSFFSADVVDIELLTDQAMFSVNYMYAKKYDTKYILAGTNFTSEGILMPENWNWFKYDKRNIKDIHKKFGKLKSKTFPFFGTYEFIYYHFFKGIRWISFLDFINYNKFVAVDTLKQRFGFIPYEYKHGESIFTRLYQNYILPKKFNIDKRKPHLSSLIMSNQIFREDALLQLKKPLYNDELLKEDIKYFLKKMKWTENYFNEYLSRNPKLHSEYKSEFSFWKKLSKIYKFIKNEKN